MQTFYHDLAEFGLPFVTPEQPEFERMAEEIRNLPSPLPPGIEGDLDGAAVVLNESGKMVLSLSVLVRFSREGRYTATNRLTSLLSVRTIELLAGRSGLNLDDQNLILPGSKRLITDRGIWGSNYDVVSPPAESGGGFMFGGGGGSLAALSADSREVQVDLAIFEDGTAAGPDDAGAFPFLVEDLRKRRELAAEIRSAIRQGATREALYNRVQPIAEQPGRAAPPHYPNLVLRSFATEVSRRVMEREDSALATWLEQQARLSRLELRRL